MMISRPYSVMGSNPTACTNKGKKVKRSEYTLTSDDIWMTKWNDYDEIFESSKEVEMSVSDPEEYLITRSDEEDGIYPLHGVKTSITLNSQAQNTLIQRDEEDDEYTIKINMEFSECTERGLFCGTSSADHPVHYHCPCCFKHSETAIPAIEAHYKSCVNKMVVHSSHFSTACKHDRYITFRECRTSSTDCLASDLKLPNHYHCPCCLIYTQQNLNQVVRHQLLCCKTLNALRSVPTDSAIPHSKSVSSTIASSSSSSSSSSSDHVTNGRGKCRGNVEDDVLGTKYDLCTHSSDVIKYKICFKDDTDFCESDERNRKKLHFHCLCCDAYADNKLRSLRKHQKSCCEYMNQTTEGCKVVFILEISQALAQYNALQTARKRSAPAGGDPMALLATKSKAPCRRNIELSCIDDSLFPKCQLMSGACRMSESHRSTHYHCPLCNVFTTRRLQRAKIHYTKCLGLSKKAKAKGATSELQCVRVDSSNNVFLVRSSTSGPGMPIHVVYKGGQNKNILHCEDGCRLDRKLRVRCKHLVAVEQFLSQSNNNNNNSTSPDIPLFSDIPQFYHLSEEQRSDVCVLYRQCSALGTPVIRPYYPNIASNKPVFTFYSVSTCTTPKYFSRAARVLVTYNERTQSFKCKCSGGCECVHINTAHLYHSYYAVSNHGNHGNGAVANTGSGVGDGGGSGGGSSSGVSGNGDAVTTHTVHHDLSRDLDVTSRDRDLHHHSPSSSLHSAAGIDTAADDLSDATPYYLKLLVK